MFGRDAGQGVFDERSERCGRQYEVDEEMRQDLERKSKLLPSARKGQRSCRGRGRADRILVKAFSAFLIFGTISD